LTLKYTPFIAEYSYKRKSVGHRKRTPSIQTTTIYVLQVANITQSDERPK